MNKKGSFTFTRPRCPACDSDKTQAVRTVGNLMRIAASAVSAIFLYPAVSYQCRCTACGRTFTPSPEER